MDTERGQIQALGTAFRRLMLAMQYRRAAIAAELEVGATEVMALSLLWADPRLTPSELARRMELTSGSITALLDRLERGGLVAREPNPEDKRSLLVRATPAGRGAMHWVFEGFDAAVARTLRTFPHLDPGEMVGFLSALTTELDQGDQRAPRW